MEDQAGVCGVVVGDQNDGPLGIRIAKLANHVRSLPLRQNPAQRTAPGREVGGYRRRAERAEGGAERAPSAQGGKAAGHTGCGTDPDRPPVGAVGCFGFDPGRSADFAQPFDDPPGRLKLPG